MAEQRRNPFVIDLNNLHEEWQVQAKLSRDAGHREAEAKHEMRLAKARIAVLEARLNVVESQLLIHVRENPEEYGMEKARPPKEVLEAAVVVAMCEDKRAVDIYLQLTEAREELIRAEFAADVAEADRVAFVDRRKALENEVELLKLNYFAEREQRPLNEDARRTLRNRDRRTEHGEPIDPDES